MNNLFNLLFLIPIAFYPKLGGAKCVNTTGNNYYNFIEVINFQMNYCMPTGSYLTPSTYFGL